MYESPLTLSIILKKANAKLWWTIIFSSSYSFLNRYERFEALKADLYSIGKRSHPGSIPSQFTLEPTSWQYSNLGVPFRVARSLKEAED